MKVVSIHDLCAAGVLACSLAFAACGDENLPSAWTADVEAVPRPSAGSGSSVAGTLGGAVAGQIAAGGAGGSAGSDAAGRAAAGSGGSGTGTGSGIAGASALAGSGGTAGRASAAGQGAQAGGGGEAAEPTFAAVFAAIQSDCNACHALDSGGLNMKTADDAYKNLVSTDSQECRGWKRVEPGKPERSVLYLAITHDSATNCTPTAMPLGSLSGWDASKADLVKAWIAAGAKR